MRFCIFLISLSISFSVTAEDFFRKTCAAHITSAMTKESLVVDSEFGLVEVLSFDPKADSAEFIDRDLHRIYRQGTGQTVFKPERMSVARVSRRNLAEVGHADSALVMDERAQRLVGIKRAGLFFALNAIKHRQRVSMTWVEEVWEPALETVRPRRRNVGYDVTTRWRMGSQDTQDLIAMIREVHRRTGENLVRSGLLQNFSQGYNRNWSWSGEPAGERGTVRLIAPHRRTQHNHFIPQDVDHYIRGVLWTYSREMFQLDEFPEPGRSANAVIDLRARTTDIRITRSTRQRDMPPVGPLTEDARWRKIWEVAGQFTVDPEQVMGRTIALYPTRNHEFVEELRRILYDAGARFVEIRE